MQAGAVWDVDVFGGTVAGLIRGEIAREVTADARSRHSGQAARSSGRPDEAEHPTPGPVLTGCPEA
jgi:hypothetical protein